MAGLGFVRVRDLVERSVEDAAMVLGLVSAAFIGRAGRRSVGERVCDDGGQGPLVCTVAKLRLLIRGLFEM